MKIKYGFSPNYQIFETTECREYNKVDKNEEVDYHRFFCFIELSRLQEPRQFTYEFMIDELDSDVFFEFKSEIYDSKTPKIVAFGDHDVIDVGLKTKNALEKLSYDVLIFLGDLAYDIQNENGARGDQYFEQMEKIFTKAPVIFTPGNHESYDRTLFFTTRIKMPGTSDPTDNNLFVFKINDILFATLNFDIPFYINPNSEIKYAKLLDNKIALFTKSWKSNYKIFFSHRPLYCTRYL